MTPGHDQLSGVALAVWSPLSWRAAQVATTGRGPAAPCAVLYSSAMHSVGTIIIA